MSEIQTKITRYLKEGSIYSKDAALLMAFCDSYLTTLVHRPQDDLILAKKLLEKLVDFVKQFTQTPYPFTHYHQKMDSPFNYYAFGLDVVRLLVDVQKSTFIGLPILHQIHAQLQKGENCIFLANHQTEADPQILDLIFSAYYPELAKNMIFVAGSRVTTDPFSIPFSLGRNLLCIYSKKYIDHPPELKEAKQHHNRQTMDKMRLLLNEGGKCIYVAPSGGRDRPNAAGLVEVAPFDANSVEMFRIIASHTDYPTHFYPLALNTYAILPPPDQVQTTLGEYRKTAIGGVGIAIGEEINFSLTHNSGKGKIEARASRAQGVFEAVRQEYQKIKSSSLLALLFIPLLFFLSSFQRIEDRAILPILSPAFMQRQTSKLILDNGLSVYLISDPQASKSAAALSVHAGSWMDPKEHLGIAHFLEHMLFLATKKYPIESEYDRFLKSHGGRANAFTEALYTTYSFEIEDSAFEEALDRFSCFFYQPLLSASGVSRELNAIQHEYAGNIENDNARRYFVQKFLSNPKHPDHQMDIGNRETLRNTTTEDLRTWFETHYNARAMHLVIYTTLPLGQIEDWVQQKFSPIPTKPLPSFQLDTPILDPKLYKHVIFIEPINQQRQLTLVWELSRAFSDAELSRPYDVMSYILGYEGEQSLLSALKSQDLASSVSAGKTLYPNNSLLFYLQIDLTKKGIKNFQTVIKRVFQAIKRIESRTVPKPLFDDIQQMQKIRFQYPKLQSPFEWVTAHAVNMREESLASYPYHSSVIQQFDPKVNMQMVGLMSIERAQIYVMANEADTHIEANLTEPWMGTHFAIRPLPLKLVEECLNPLLDPKIDLPQTNPFIPKKLILKHELKQKNSSEQETWPQGRLIQNRPHGKLYFAADQRYGNPEISWTLNLRTPYVNNGDPSSVVHADLAIKAFQESLNPYGYDAKMAGLNYEIHRHFNGMTIKINGYSENAKPLLERILQTLCSLQIELPIFQRLKNDQLEEYLNYAKKGPLLRGIDQFKRLFHLDYVTENIKAKEIVNVTHESMNCYLKGLFNQTYLEGLVYGNMTKEEAESIWSTIWEILQTKAYPKEDHLKMRVALFPETGNPLFVNYQVASKGNAFILAIEQDPYSLDLHAYHDIAARMLSSLYFSALRTEQQTGYQVAVSDQEIDKQLLMLFLIETHTHEPRDLLTRTECVIEKFVNDSLLKEHNQKAFETLRQTRIKELLTTPENMQVMGEKLYELSFSKGGNFNWYKERAQSFQKLEFNEFNQQIQKMFGRANHKRVAVLVQGKIDPADQFRYKRIKSGKWLQDLNSYRTQEERE